MTAPTGEDPSEPVAVLEAGDPATLAVAKSILDDGGIEFFAKGEAVQDLFGWGRLFTGFSLVAGPVHLLVAAEDADDARAALRKLSEQSPDQRGRQTGGENQ